MGEKWIDTLSTPLSRYDLQRMDWNTLLLWMAAPSCVISLYTAMRASPKLKGWIFVCLLIMATGGISFFLLPQKAGYIVGSMWALLLVGPAVLQRSAARYSLQQRHNLAAMYSTVAGILHPFDGLPQQSKFLRGISLAERGEKEAAIRTFKDLEKTAPLHIARIAGLHARRLRGDWVGVTGADIALLDQLDIRQEQEHRFSAAQGHGKKPLVTYALILANIAVFVVELIKGGARGNWDDAVNRLGAMHSDVLRTHEYYRLFMANFLHFGYAHLIMNMLALYVLGPFVEFSLGRLLYLMVYLIAGVGVMCSVLCLQLQNWMDPNESLVGASGAIMAVVGATAAILLRGWYRERAAAAMRRLRMVGLILVFQVTFDHFTPEVSGMAHILGMVWGFVLASMLPHRNDTGLIRGVDALPVAATQKP